MSIIMEALMAEEKKEQKKLLLSIKQEVEQGKDWATVVDGRIEAIDKWLEELGWTKKSLNR